MFLTYLSILYTQSFPPIQSYPLEVYEAGNQNWMITQSNKGEIYIAIISGFYHLTLNVGNYIQQTLLFDL